jgi:hypothetical protein
MQDPQTEAAAALMRQVQTGMKVVDASGDEVGTVEDMSMGDPEAATTAGNEPRPTGGVLRDLAEAVTTDRPGPDVPEPLRDRLIREGYLKIKHGLLGSAVYVSSEQLQRVEGDRVVLRVRRDELER